MPVVLTDAEVDGYALTLAEKIKQGGRTYSNLFPIPSGDIPVAYKLASLLNLKVTFNLDKNSLVVDDLVDSGRTISRFPSNDIAVLFTKNPIEIDMFYAQRMPETEWIHFPWEKIEHSGEDIVLRMLQYIGEDAFREGLLETPSRVVRSWGKLYGGYKENPKDIIKVFDKETYDEMVLLKGVEFYSTCEHHLLPFYGKASIAYIPKKKVIGVSKLARLLEIYSRRMQIQERLCEQITLFLMENLEPEGAACILEATHLCMTARGVQKQRSRMVTSSLKGCFEDHEVRAEFFSLAKD